MAKVAPTDGFIIKGWMRTSLDLKKEELLTFALVHQFSQSSAGVYTGGVSYLMSFLGCSYNTALNHLKALVEKGLLKEIKGEVNGVKFCNYYTANIAGVLQNLEGGTAKFGDRNIKESNINNSLSNKGKSQFQKPTIEEIRQYCTEKDLDIDAEQFFNFYESKGWLIGKSPMKNWRAAVATWAGRQERERKSQIRSAPSQKKESVFEHNLKMMDQMFGTDMHSKAYGKKEVYDEQ